MRVMLLSLALVMCCAWTADAQDEAVALEGNWPQFRGPGGNGVADDTESPLMWSTTENVAWVSDVPGHGWSSPIVWGSRLFVTTALELESPSRSFAGLGGDDLPLRLPEGFSEPVRYMLYCLDVETGQTLWSQEAHRDVPLAPIHLKNSLATETPATDGQRVYAYFGAVGLFAYSLDGELLWKHAVTSRKMFADVGPGSSPVVADGRVYLLRDSDDESSLIALDAETGEELWRVQRRQSHPETGSSWMTPLYWKNSVRAEIVTTTAGMIASYATDGTELWRIENAIRDVVASPVSFGDVAYIPVGSPWENDRPLYAVRAGASGDISSEKVTGSDAFVRWHQRIGAAYLPSPLVYRGNIYVVGDRGILAVYDALTGERRHRARIGDGTGFSSSPGWVWIFAAEWPQNAHVRHSQRVWRAGGTQGGRCRGRGFPERARPQRVGAAVPAALRRPGPRTAHNRSQHPPKPIGCAAQLRWRRCAPVGPIHPPWRSGGMNLVRKLPGEPEFMGMNGTPWGAD